MTDLIVLIDKQKTVVEMLNLLARLTPDEVLSVADLKLIGRFLAAGAEGYTKEIEDSTPAQNQTP